MKIRLDSEELQALCELFDVGCLAFPDIENLENIERGQRRIGRKTLIPNPTLPSRPHQVALGAFSVLGHMIVLCSDLFFYVNYLQIT